MAYIFLVENMKRDKSYDSLGFNRNNLELIESF